VSFSTVSEALSWLESVNHRHPLMGRSLARLIRFENLQCTIGPTAYDVLRRTARLLVSGRLVLLVNEEKLPQGVTSAAPARPAAFPRSERRPPPPPPPAPAVEPSTFDIPLNFAAQAAALLAAAAAGAALVPQ